ncbi:MAG: ribose-phosphate pyrophosphokinase [Clostridiales bacterium]|nr:ribose-phosphate pyrophosphokinase [Clostridiales bacterium]
MPGSIRVFSCNSNKQLAGAIAGKLNTNLGRSEVGTFSDGEIYTKIDETIRGADVYIVQSTCPPVNDNLMELLIMTDAMKRASAGNINMVIPYFGYARQDRKARARDPITAKLVANLLTTAGADRVITMDMHCSQIQGFFDIPVDHLLGQPLIADYYGARFADDLADTVVVSPDLGSVARSRAFATRLDVPLAIVDKRRPKANVSEIMNIIGSIEGKRVILADDIIDTAGTITNAANALVERGAKEVFACCTHAVLSGPSIERIEKSAIKELTILDTIPLSPEKMIGKIKILSVADIFCEAIKRIHGGLSVSELFS